MVEFRIDANVLTGSIPTTLGLMTGAYSNVLAVLHCPVESTTVPWSCAVI
jgi:hypothetical protein